MTNYQSDGLGRLIEESEAADSETLTKAYAYDKAGNRETMAISGTENYTTDYAYDLNNRLKTEIKDKGLTIETAEYQYDKNGNQISKTTFTTGNGGGAEEVGIYALGSKLPQPREDYTVEINEYDVFNRLVKVQNDEGTSIYAYKSDGLRIGTTKTEIMGSTGSEDVISEFIWDGTNIVAEITDGEMATYFRGINLISADKNGAKNYYLFNAHGDVVQMTNSSGGLIKSYQYDSFGVEINPDPDDDNIWRFAGEMFVKETGDYYMRARVYDPSTGIFTSEDPVRDGLNFYTYCMGNPISFVDPDGLTPYAIRSEKLQNRIGVPTVYSLYISDRVQDGVVEAYSLIPFVSLGFDIAFSIGGLTELSVDEGAKGLKDYFESAINNEVFSTSMDITTGVFDMIDLVGEINGVDYLADAKVLGPLSKGAGWVGTFLSVWSVGDYLLGNEHIINQVVEHFFSRYMYASSTSAVEKKYSMVYILVGSLLENNEFTYKTDLFGTIDLSTLTFSMDDRDNIVEVLRLYDESRVEYSKIIEWMYG